MPTRNSRGHWQNKEGEWVHPDLVPVDRKLEDEVVEKLIVEAKALKESMQDFKIRAFAQCYDFMDMLRQEYGMKRLAKSQSGAVTLKSFNGVWEVQIAIAKLLTFDNKLALAKEKIDAYLEAKTAGADPEIQTLITRAFDVKNGKVDAKQILSLKSYNISDPLWKAAMAMIDDATEIAGTKSYIRFKERERGHIDGKLEMIVLDIAGLDIADDEIERYREKEKS